MNARRARPARSHDQRLRDAVGYNLAMSLPKMRPFAMSILLGLALAAALIALRGIKGAPRRENARGLEWRPARPEDLFGEAG